MKAVLLLFVLACALALAYGDLVCGTKYCDQHPCTAPVKAQSCQSPSKYVEKHSGKCACCPACVTQLAEGARCKTYSKELGETPSAVCASPLVCVGGVCTKVQRRN
ncbi:fungal protease inhibitor-1-like [Leguminivora glycinivorella]|uniref:fungal protease inhibitor-1-like n=1 Tax=Leguminivora glycinivorella TaxID=1035111 RepID=UPI00200E90E9|nr:fungal protease inhibitor-1-like [Leguminivora glycinivorella]